MGPNNGSLANGLHHVDIPSKLSATENEDVSRSQRIAAIATYYKAAHEMTARRMAKPTVLPASVTVFGFSAGAGDAEDRNAGAASGSESASPVSQRFDGEMLPSDNRLDAAIYFRLEAMRQDLLNHAADHSEALDKQAAQRRRLNDSSNSLTASHEAKPLEVEEVEDEELTLLNLASSTAATHSGINGIQAQPKPQQASSQALQLRTPMSMQALLPQNSPSSISSETDMLGQSSRAEPSQVPADAVGSLLNVGSPTSEPFGRRKPKKAGSPLTKSKLFRLTKHKAQTLRSSRLSVASPLGTAVTPDAAESAEADMHRYLPLQDVDSEPCGGVWQKLSSSLSAVWQWLCSSGSSLMKLGRKLRKKLLTALGMGQEEAQRLLAQQQAEEAEALSVRSYNPLQPVNRPEGHHRLQRWRL